MTHGRQRHLTASAPISCLVRDRLLSCGCRVRRRCGHCGSGALFNYHSSMKISESALVQTILATVVVSSLPGNETSSVLPQPTKTNDAPVIITTTTSKPTKPLFVTLRIPATRWECRVLEYNRTCISVLYKKRILVMRATPLDLTLKVYKYNATADFASANEHGEFQELCDDFVKLSA